MLARRPRAAFGRFATADRRFSWHPAHPVVSPGLEIVPLRIDCTIIPFSSSNWKYTNRSAGTSTYADPSASTGAVPRIRLLLKSSHAIPGACVPLPSQAGCVQNRFSGDSTTRIRFTVPRFTRSMPVPT